MFLFTNCPVFYICRFKESDYHTGFSRKEDKDLTSVASKISQCLNFSKNLIYIIMLHFFYIYNNDVELYIIDIPVNVSKVT